MFKTTSASKSARHNSRRMFLAYSGATLAASGLLLAGCKDDEPNPTPNPNDPDPTDPETVSFGTGDVAILNYAYALEQLEAAFYTAVIAGSYYAGAPEEEKAILADLQKHEVIHRDFFKAALTAAAPDAIIPDLEVDFSTVDFSNRESVLGTAKVFEDLGVSAYNGAGQFLQNADFLLLAGKIVSVEARHASAIRDLLNPGSADFAGDDVIDPATGLEITRSLQDVLTAAAPFITTEIDASGLPSGGFQVTV